MKLFDCLDIPQLASKKDMLNAKVEGKWRAYSRDEVKEKVYQLAAALLKLGLSAGDGTTVGRDKIGLISNSRPEWIIVDMAVQLIGCILVPLYPNASLKEVKQILIEAEIKCLFVSNTALEEMVNTMKNDLPLLKDIYLFDALPVKDNWEKLLQPLSDDDINFINTVCGQVTEDDVTTIIFTSGTTGVPKGVMLTHKNIMSNVIASSKVLAQIPMDEKRVLSFLPLNHIFEKMSAYMFLYNGFSIYYAEHVDTIGANMQEVKPYIFTTVPRLLEKIYEKIITEGQKLKGIKRIIFLWSIKIASQFEHTGTNAWYNLKLAIADQLVYKLWRNALGGNISAIFVGGAACPVRLIRIFTAARMVVLEGYGLTETSPAISLNQYKTTGRKFGTVGPLLENIEVKIAPDGEIMTKSQCIMAGYYKNEEATDEVLRNDWFYTGDIGELSSDGFLKITDRKKDIFKTSGGKYVAPVPIENQIKESPYIEHLMVIGDERKFTSALIVPSFVNLRLWCEQNNINLYSKVDIVHDHRVVDMFQSIVDSFSHEFNHVEQIKKFILLTEDWTVEGGQLTPTGKIKRRIILDKYKVEIEMMYSNIYQY